MVTQIRFLGVSAFEIRNTKGTTIIIDPFLDNNPVSPVKADDLKKVDMILVTHAAFDHLGDAVKIAKKFEVPVICGADVKAYLMTQGVKREQLFSTMWGVTMEQAGIKVRSVENRNWSSVLGSDGTHFSGPPMSFILYVEPGVRIIHLGATALFNDLRLIGELYNPIIGMINVSDPEIDSKCFDNPSRILTGAMTPYEAALAAQWLGVKYAIPMHYSTHNRDVQDFVDLLDKISSRDKHYVKPVVLKPGEILNYQKEEEDKKEASY
ncbi:metal-dependent hydrolase [[Eubacterium] cellulosolvens]